VVVVYALVAPAVRILEPSDAAQLVPILDRLPPLVRRPALAFVHSLAGARRRTMELDR
jgi:hypothetical protein